MKRALRRIQQFFADHPTVTQAARWAIPAIVVGLIFRLILMSYSPYAYWGSDSRSYFGFTHGLMTTMDLSLQEKRRYVYPIFLLPISLLPGSPLKWLGWIQAFIGLVTLIPLAYVVRRTFHAWRWFIIPITVLYAGMPLVIWYEHEMLAENLFFASLIWTLAGWVAWTSQPDHQRAARLWWWFFVPFAVFVLLKPAARFFWPGLVCALVLVAAWRVLRIRHVFALLALFLVSLTAGSGKQGSWLLYTTVFPLTQLDTPLHADLKEEVRDMVQDARNDIATYAANDDEEFDFLRSPKNQAERPKWQALGKNEKTQDKVYRELALEAIKARPDLFLWIALQRFAGSMNLTDFDTERLEADYFARRFEPQYKERRTSETMIRLSMGIPLSGPMPSFEEISKRISPAPESRAATFLVRYANAYQTSAPLVHHHKNPDGKFTGNSLTWLGWWLIGGSLLSLQCFYRRQLGVWPLILFSALLATFLVGIQNHRYFAPAWPFVLIYLALPVDAVVRLVSRMRSARSA